MGNEDLLDSMVTTRSSEIDTYKEPNGCRNIIEQASYICSRRGRRTSLMLAFPFSVKAYLASVVPLSPGRKLANCAALCATCCFKVCARRELCVPTQGV